MMKVIKWLEDFFGIEQYIDLYQGGCTVNYNSSKFTANQDGAFENNSKLRENQLIAKSEQGWLYKVEGDCSDYCATVLLCKIGNRYGIKVYPLPDSTKTSGGTYLTKEWTIRYKLIETTTNLIIKKLAPQYSIEIVFNQRTKSLNAILRANGKGQPVYVGKLDEDLVLLSLDTIIAFYDLETKAKIKKWNNRDYASIQYLDFKPVDLEKLFKGYQF